MVGWRSQGTPPPGSTRKEQTMYRTSKPQIAAAMVATATGMAMALYGQVPDSALIAGAALWTMATLSGWPGRRTTRKPPCHTT